MKPPGNSPTAALLATALALLATQPAPAESWTNQRLLTLGCPWTDDANDTNGWTLHDGLLLQQAANDDTATGGDRLLVIPDALESIWSTGKASVSVQLMLGDYKDKNGIWQGLVLFVDCENPVPSQALAVILERADADGIHGGLRIHYPGGMSELSQLGPARYHDSIQHPTWADLLWVGMTVNLTLEGTTLRVEATAIPLDGDGSPSLVATASAQIPASTFSKSGVALATSAQYGKGTNPRVYFDALSVRAEHAPPPERPWRRVSRAVAEAYVTAEDLAPFEIWPELLWDTPDLVALYRGLSRKLYRLKQVMPWDDYVELTAEPSVRVHTFFGGMIYIEEILPSLRNEAGQPLNEVERAALMQRCSDLNKLLQARINNRHAEMADRSAAFAANYPDEPFLEVLAVAHLHALFHLRDRRAEYWELADRLMAELPEGDLRDRVAYNRIVQWQTDKKLPEARAEIEAFLVSRPNTGYRPLLLSDWLGGLYNEKDWEALESLAVRTQQLYEPGTRENWDGRLFQGMVILYRDGDTTAAYDIFYQLSSEDPVPPDPHQHLPSKAAQWALVAASRAKDPDRLEQMIARLDNFPGNRMKRDLMLRYAPDLFEQRYPDHAARLFGANPRPSTPRERWAREALR